MYDYDSDKLKRSTNTENWQKTPPLSSFETSSNKLSMFPTLSTLPTSIKATENQQSPHDNSAFCHHILPAPADNQQHRPRKWNKRGHEELVFPATRQSIPNPYILKFIHRLTGTDDHGQSLKNTSICAVDQCGTVGFEILKYFNFLARFLPKLVDFEAIQAFTRKSKIAEIPPNAW